jgi:D-glycero-D-manno-heptose 1,7-bisphosphate phosphatase
MVLEAERDLNLDLGRSWFVGDKTADVECGRNAGTRTILVHTGYGAKEINSRPDFMAKDVVAAAQIILQNSDATTR